MTYREMLQAKEKAVAAAKALQSSVGARAMTAEEQSQFDSYLTEAENMQAQIAAADRLRDLDRSSNASISAEVGKNRAEDKPWANQSEFFSTVISTTKANRVTDPRLQAALGSSEAVPSDGGFAVPVEYADGLLSRTFDVGLVSSRCRSITMSSSRLVMNAVKDDSRVDGQRNGGLQAFWESEANNYQGTKPALREVQFVANKLIGLTYLTEELQSDTQAIGSWVDEVFPDEFAFKIDDACINGVGSGMPLGILNPKNGSLIVQTKDNNQAAATITASNVLNMWSRLAAFLRKDACWFIEQSVEPELYPLQFPNTVGTQNTMMYTPPGMYGNNSDYGLLMGKPVIPIEQAAALGAQGDITLASMSQYYLAKRQEMRADSSIHVAFLTGQTALRFMLRLDGQSWWDKPITPKAKNAPTRSPFVTLAARS